MKNNLVIFSTSTWIDLILKECIPNNKFKNIYIFSDSLPKKNYKRVIFFKTQKINYNFVNKNIDINQCFFLSFGSPWIFEKKFLSSLSQPIYNIHQSPLPKFKGSIASYVILFNLRALQTSIHLVNEKIDDGEIVYERDIYISDNLKTPLEINNYIQSENRKMLLEFLNHISKLKNIPLARKQNTFFSSYLPRLNSNINGWIDWSMSVEQIDRFIRSFDEPYEGAKTKINGITVSIKNISFSNEDASIHPFTNGIILRKFKDNLVVSVKNGSIYIKEIFNNKKNIFSKIKIGDKLHTPSNYLDLSFSRVLYNNKNNKIYSNKYNIKKKL